MPHLLLLALCLLIAGTPLAHAVESAARPAFTATDTPAMAVAPSAAPDPLTLETLLDPPSRASTGISNLRTQLLTDAGRTLGFRGGQAARAQVLRGTLQARADRLDTIFQFSPLIAQNGTIAPVIVEARDLAAFSPDQIRTATRVYKIERAERFVSVPPTWRDYLFVGLAVDRVELPDLGVRPQDGKERELWKDAVRAGWDDGQKQADAILVANFNRLTRDYIGMVRYSTLLQAGMITGTRVVESQQTVVGEGTQLTLGDTLRRVTGRAGFVADPNRWRPTVNSGFAPAAVAEPVAVPVPAASAEPDAEK